jgi:hypothetical protein
MSSSPLLHGYAYMPIHKYQFARRGGRGGDYGVDGICQAKKTVGKLRQRHSLIQRRSIQVPMGREVDDGTACRWGWRWRTTIEEEGVGSSIAHGWGGGMGARRCVAMQRFKPIQRARVPNRGIGSSNMLRPPLKRRKNILPPFLNI